MQKEQTSINDYVSVISGYAFKSEWFGSGSDKVIRIGDLKNGEIDTRNALSVNASEHKISDIFKIEKNDILIALSGATVGKIAFAKEQDSGCYINQRVAIVRCNEKLHPNYLKYFFDGYYLSELLKNAGGAAQPNLSPKQISLLKIPLPPIQEQKRIAEILDKADEIRTQRKQSIQKLDDLLQATFIEMFGDPVLNPKGWELVKIKDIVDEFIGGKNIECPENSNSPYKILKVSAVTSKIYKPFESKKAPNEFEPNQLAIVEKGDLLFSRANTTELVGATAYVWETPNNIVLPDKLWKFLITKHNLINKLFLWELFKNPSFRNSLSKLSSGTSGSMKNIAKSKLNEMLMPLPSKDLQEKFALTSERIWTQKQWLEKQLNEYERLFQSLQQRAFNGEL